MRHGTVDTTLRFVGQQFVNAGLPDPRKPGGGKELDLPIKNLLSRYKEVDPATQHQVAVPVDLIEFVSRQRACLKQAAIADLIELQFLFLLRVGEYTMPAVGTTTRTIQFSREDVTFWKDQRVLSHHLSFAELSQADCITLTLRNQKNGKKNARLTQFNNLKLVNPVHVAARIVKRVLNASALPSTPLCAYRDTAGAISQVTAADINATVKLAAIAIDLHLRGYDINKVGSHSLRSGGAMAMHLNGVGVPAIKKLGRWSGDTFMTYIHEQIASTMQNVSSLMTRRVPNFFNVAV